MATLVEHMSCFNALSTEDVDWVMKSNQKEAIGVCVAAIKKHRLLKMFKPIFTDRIFTINDFDGWAMNAAKLNKVFPGGVDPDVENWGLNESGAWGLNESGGLTQEISPRAYELQSDFYFSEEWDKFFIWPQVVRFCEKYPELFGEIFYTLFPVKKGNERFVADVDVRGDGLYVDVIRFEYDIVCSAGYGHRLVVPQPLFS